MNLKNVAKFFPKSFPHFKPSRKLYIMVLFYTGGLFMAFQKANNMTKIPIVTKAREIHQKSLDRLELQAKTQKTLRKQQLAN
jgi:hypothetical protein